MRQMLLDVWRRASNGSGNRAARVIALAACVLPGVVPTGVLASDHGDTALLRSLQRHDARITDLFAFIRSENLVLAVCLDPTVPEGATEYVFPPDLTLRISIDTHSEVRFDDPDDVAVLGGTVAEPGRIAADVEFEFRFGRRHRPDLKVRGLPGRVKKEIDLFIGLRDDPFIRGPRIGRNVAALVLQLPAAEMVEAHGTILVWATSKIPEVHGSQVDLAGRGLRNQFPENEAMNLLSPRDHLDKLGVMPDVLIFDTSHSASFPNGRDLADDVVDLVGDPRPLANDAPFPSTNDVPFLDDFPYLAPPQ
ncbi:MAG: hypothetical protein ACE5HU_03345 [Acidobacteriota bacterium]